MLPCSYGRGHKLHITQALGVTAPYFKMQGLDSTPANWNLLQRLQVNFTLNASMLDSETAWGFAYGCLVQTDRVIKGGVRELRTWGSHKHPFAQGLSI